MSIRFRMRGNLLGETEGMEMRWYVVSLYAIKLKLFSA